MSKPEFVSHTERIYKSFSKKINKLKNVKGHKRHEITLEVVAKSAYVKCYDFMSLICQFEKPEHSFFMLPNLRGILEDLIAISYLLTLPEQQQKSILYSKSYREYDKTISAQADYFDKYNPSQIVLPSNYILPLKKTLENMSTANCTLTEQHLPGINKMCGKLGLMDLYNFMYNATSKSAHFDIGTLMAMGWGNWDKKSPEIEINFSHENNYHHYYKFVFFYTSQMFMEQTKSFKSIVDKDGEIWNHLIELDEGYSKIDWPTIVSFKQMNVPEPSEFERVIRRTLYNIEVQNKSS